MKRGLLGVWGFRHLALRLLYYVEKLKLSYDLAFQKAYGDIAATIGGADKRLAYYAGRDFISRYYTLEHVAETVYGKHWRRRKTRILADLWVYYYGEEYIDKHEYRRFSKKIARDARRGRLRGLEEVFEGLDGVTRVSVELSYPRWLVAELSEIIGLEETTKMLGALNVEVHWLRVNTTRTDVDAAIDALRAERVVVEKHPVLDYMVKVLETPKPIPSIKAVRSGYLTPQDLGSAYVAEELEEGGVLFDACSAPGGKLAVFLMRRQGYGVGCDLSVRRLAAESSLLKQAGTELHRASLVRCDAASYEPARRTSQVLLDAPCTGSGSIRRDPAVKVALERRSRISYYVSLQRRLLMRAARASRGIVVYATCSILPEEGERIAQDYELIGSRTGLPSGYGGVGHRLYPHVHDSGGFFIARLSPV